MASSSKTTNGLNVWSRSDIPEMADFNADNRIIDEAISKANDPLAQIGEGGISAEYLAAGVTGFGSVVPRSELGTGDPLTPATGGAPLYIFGGDNIEVLDWSQGENYQQLCIRGEKLINYFHAVDEAAASTFNAVKKEGIFAILPGSAPGTKPEQNSTTALLIQFKPTGASEYTQIWIGDGVYRREQTGGSWGAWGSISSKAVSGDTAGRPASPMSGACYFDTDLGRPIWWNGASGAWVDAAGKTV